MKIPEGFRTCAIHEAGHAVIAAATGVPIDPTGAFSVLQDFAGGVAMDAGVAIHSISQKALDTFRRDREEGRTDDADYAERMRILLTDVMVSLAGEEAEAMFGEAVSADLRNDRSHDATRQTALFAALCAPKEEPAIRETLREAVRKLFRENEAGVRAVACRFMEAGAVTPEEIRELTGLPVRIYDASTTPAPPMNPFAEPILGTDE